MERHRLNVTGSTSRANTIQIFYTTQIFYTIQILNTDTGERESQETSDNEVVPCVAVPVSGCD